MSESRPIHTVEESMIWRNGRNNGIYQERERIIKLLKESDSVCNEWAIALIKGETK